MSTTYTRGIRTAYGTGFLMQSVGLDPQKDKETARDNLGNTAAVDYYDEREVLTFTAITADEATLPKPGDTITYDGHDYLVDSAPKSRSNTGYPSVSVTATRYITNGIPAQSSSSSSSASV